MTTKQAIEHVLKGKRRMTVAAIFEAAYPLTELKGQTPKQTFYAVMYGAAKREDGFVERVGKGTFRLRPKRRKAA